MTSSPIPIDLASQSGNAPTNSGSQREPASHSRDPGSVLAPESALLLERAESVGWLFLSSYYEFYNSKIDSIFKMYHPSASISHAVFPLALDSSEPLEPRSVHFANGVDAIKSRFSTDKSLKSSSKDHNRILVTNASFSVSLTKNILIVVSGEWSRGGSPYHQFFQTFYLVPGRYESTFDVANDVLNFVDYSAVEEIVAVSESPIPKQESFKLSESVKAVHENSSAKSKAPEPKNASIQETKKEIGVESKKDIDAELNGDAVVESQEGKNGFSKESLSEAKTKTIPEPKKEYASQVKKDPSPVAPKEPVSEVKKETVSDVKKEPTPEVKKVPGLSTRKDPVGESKKETVPEPKKENSREVAARKTTPEPAEKKKLVGDTPQVVLSSLEPESKNGKATAVNVKIKDDAKTFELVAEPGTEKSESQPPSPALRSDLAASQPLSWAALASRAGADDSTTKPIPAPGIAKALAQPPKKPIQSQILVPSNYGQRGKKDEWYPIYIRGVKGFEEADLREHLRKKFGEVQFLQILVNIAYCDFSTREAQRKAIESMELSMNGVTFTLEPRESRTGNNFHNNAGKKSKDKPEKLTASESKRVRSEKKMPVLKKPSKSKAMA